MVPGPHVLPEAEDIPIPDADDSVIDFLTDHMTDFDESSTDALEIFVVIGGDKKHVEVTERTMADEDRKLFRRAGEAVFQSWLDHKVFHVASKRVADKDRVLRVRWVMTWTSTTKAKARLCSWRPRPRLDRSSSRQPQIFSAQADALILQGVASKNWKWVSKDIKKAFLSRDEEHLNPTAQ